MLRLLKRLFCPPTATDSTLVWKKWTVDLAGRRVAVQVELDSSNVDPTPCMDFAEQLIDRLVNDDTEFRIAAAQELTASYNNDGWNVGTPISKAEFARRLSLVFVLITGTHENCFGSVTYDADGMFTEHTVHLMVGHDFSVEGSEVS